MEDTWHEVLYRKWGQADETSIKDGQTLIRQYIFDNNLLTHFMITYVQNIIYKKLFNPLNLKQN